MGVKVLLYNLQKVKSTTSSVWFVNFCTTAFWGLD